jgi:hypothetical protein
MALLFVWLAPVGALAQDAETEGGDLAKAAQNPVADLISLPFQYNASFGIGPEDRTQNLLNIQPVLPFTVGGVTLINRTIAPILYQPDATRSSGGELGLGDINHTVFFSPARASRVTWGVGPGITLPTATDDTLGTGKLSLGPSAVVLMMPGRWVVGTLVSNSWSVAGDSERADVNQFLLQYFVNYNMAGGWYVVSAPIVTANWEADSGERWVVPFGGGLGRVFRVGTQPINTTAQAYYNAQKPTGGSPWSLRLQLQLLFPK